MDRLNAVLDEFSHRELNNYTLVAKGWMKEILQAVIDDLKAVYGYPKNRIIEELQAAMGRLS